MLTGPWLCDARSCAIGRAPPWAGSHRMYAHSRACGSRSVVAPGLCRCGGDMLHAHAQDSAAAARDACTVPCWCSAGGGARAGHAVAEQMCACRWLFVILKGECGLSVVTEPSCDVAVRRPRRSDLPVLHVARSPLQRCTLPAGFGALVACCMALLLQVRRAFRAGLCMVGPHDCIMKPSADRPPNKQTHKQTHTRAHAGSSVVCTTVGPAAREPSGAIPCARPLPAAQPRRGLRDRTACARITALLHRCARRRPVGREGVCGASCARAVALRDGTLRLRGSALAQPPLRLDVRSRRFMQHCTLRRSCAA